MSLKFEAVKSLNVGGMEMIPIKTNDDKRVFVKTDKCFSFGVKKDKMIKTTPMSLKLEDAATASLQNIIGECEAHLGKPLSKRVFYKDNTVYPKFKATTKLYEGADETDPAEYEDTCCDVKTVLEISGILLNGDKTRLQLKVYKALVKEHVREHVWVVDTEW